MIFFLRLCMLASWFILVGVVVLFSISVIGGDFSQVFAETKFERLGLSPASIFGLLAVTLGALAVVCGAVILWNIHCILGQRIVQDFAKLSRHVRHIAIGLASLWGVTSLLPDVLIGAMILQSGLLDENLEIGFPVDLNIFMLFVAAALFVLSKALSRAEMIDHENRNFL